MLKRLNLQVITQKNLLENGMRCSSSISGKLIRNVNTVFNQKLTKQTFLGVKNATWTND